MLCEMGSTIINKKNTRVQDYQCFLILLKTKYNVTTDKEMGEIFSFIALLADW